MDAESEKIIAALEQRIVMLESASRKNDMALQSQIDGLLKMVNNHHKLHQIYKDEADDLSRELQKMREVYYHVFPDRLEADARFERQLCGLNSKADPDGKKDQA
jgi:hypothetical protein